MRGNTAPAILSGDFDDLTAALDRLAGMAPSGYPNWASIARDGANAARAQSIEAVRAACRSCHAQYRDRYRHELRSRPLP
jgi:cytochrome c556